MNTTAAFYPVGTPGQSWGAPQRAQWLARQTDKMQRHGGLPHGVRRSRNPIVQAVGKWASTSTAGLVPTAVAGDKPAGEGSGDCQRQRQRQQQEVPLRFVHPRAVLCEAHDKGLKARYWDTPTWPVGLRNHIWKILVEEGADFLNVDDLRSAKLADWDKSWRDHMWMGGF